MVLWPKDEINKNTTKEIYHQDQVGVYELIYYHDKRSATPSMGMWCDLGNYGSFIGLQNTKWAPN